MLAANGESRQLQTAEAAETERESESDVQDCAGKPGGGSLKFRVQKNRALGVGCWALGLGLWIFGFWVQGLSSDSGFVRVWVIGVTVQGCAWLEAPDVQKVRCSEDAGSHVMNGAPSLHLISARLCKLIYIYIYTHTPVHILLGLCLYTQTRHIHLCSSVGRSYEQYCNRLLLCCMPRRAMLTNL